MSKIKSLGKKSTVWDNSQSYSAETEMVDITDPIYLNDMSREIEQLDKESQEQIYMFLRKFKPAKFFTVESKGTYFDRTKLTDKQLRELFNFVVLCKKHRIRQSIIENAEKDHASVMGHTVTDQIDLEVDAVNPSEKDKLEEMLLLNNQPK